MRVRHIAASDDGRRVACAAFREHVEIWDLPSRKRISSFDTILDFGGKRLILSGDGSLVIAAAYQREGIAAYDAENGRVVWHRRDLKKAQRLTCSQSSDRIYAGFERGPGCVLNSRTGETISRHRGVRRFTESAHDPLIFLDGARPSVATSNELERVFPIERRTFAFLAAAFGPGQLVVSEAGGDVSVFELRDGRRAWTFCPPTGVHCLDLMYCEKDGAFYGILWPYMAGGDKDLVRFNEDGTLRLIANIGLPAETAFVPRSDTLITSDRRLISVLDGSVQGLIPRH